MARGKRGTRGRGRGIGKAKEAAENEIAEENMAEAGDGELDEAGDGELDEFDVEDNGEDHCEKTEMGRYRSNSTDSGQISESSQNIFLD